MKRWLAVLGVLLAGALLLPQHAWSQPGAIVNNGLQINGTPPNLYLNFNDGTYTGTLQPPAPLSGNLTWTLPNVSGTIITTGNASALSGLVSVSVNAPLTGDGTTGNELTLNYNTTTLSVSGGQLTANNTAAIWNANQLCGTDLNCTALSGLGTGDAGKVLTWDGAQWTAQAVPGDDWGNQVVQVNAPLTGDGTTGNELTLNYNTTTLSVSGGQLTANNTAAIWNANQLCGTDLNCTALSGLGTGDAGKVLTWDGAQWTAQAVPGDDWGNQVVQVNAPLTGDGTTGNELTLNYNTTTLSVSGGQLTANNTAAIWNANQLCGTDLNCTALSGLGTGDAGKVLTWDGAQWTAQAVPGDDWGNQVVQVNAPLTGDGTTGNELTLNYNTTTLSVSGGQLTANNTAAIWNANQLCGTNLNCTALSGLGTGDAGKVLTWNGSQWTALPVPGDNWGTQVVQVNAPLTGDGTSGNKLGLAIDATTLSVNASNQLTANNTSAIWNANQLCGTNLNCTALSGLGTGDAGKVLTWNGSQWTALPVPGDNWGTQVVQVNAPLTGDGTSGNKLGLAIDATTLSVNASNQLTANNTSAIWNANQLCGTNLNCTALSGLGTGDAGKVLMWDGAQWTAQSVAAAGGWSLTGNSGTNPAFNFLGTTDDQPVIIKTNGVERMRITNSANNGFVGIGVTSPTYRLQLPNTANNAGRAFANAWLNPSSMRWKEDIRPIPNALEKVLALRGVNFRWKPEYGGTEDIGFLAEEVARVVPEVVSYEPDGQVGAMDYGRLTALLVEALKEEHRRNEALRAEVAELRSLVEQLLRQNGERGTGSQPSTIQDAWLGQNIPNPFAGTTTIPYYIPAGVSRAELVVRDVGGRELKRLELAERGAHGQVVLEMGLMGSGTYEYALVLDGRVVAVKQMTLIR
jgi:hypothetical protein